MLRIHQGREENPMQEKMIEKNRRKAFLGLQLKYTLAPVLWLYGIVFVCLTGVFLYNWFTKVVNAQWEVSFLEQLKGLPLGPAFFVLVLGVQLILKVGFSKQGKNVLAMKRIPLPEETIGLIRLEYSFLLTVSAFLVYFLMLCSLLFLDNILAPENAYGVSELYPAFYHFTHLYRVYPVINGWTCIAFLVVIMAVSSMAPMAEEIRSEGGMTYAVWIIFMIGSFLFYCFEEGNGLHADLGIILIFSTTYIVKVMLAYRRRQKC